MTESFRLNLKFLVVVKKNYGSNVYLNSEYVGVIILDSHRCGRLKFITNYLTDHKHPYDVLAEVFIFLKGYMNMEFLLIKLMMQICFIPEDVPYLKILIISNCESGLTRRFTYLDAYVSP